MVASTTNPPSFQLSKLSIGHPPFRKLKNIEIEFAERITLVAGHNGIGKSTILALVANGSGLARSEFSSYTGREYRGNLNEIIFLDYENEFVAKKAASALSNPMLEYKLNNSSLTKRCALTKRTVKMKQGGSRLEVRVVPRNHPIVEFKEPVTGVDVGVAAKVPIPTLYLGMTRMLPIGESDPEDVENQVDKTIDQSDAKFISSFINEVIGVSASKDDELSITTQTIKGTKKVTKHPAYDHSPKSVSLGQDSLSAIATAFASFRKLEREWPEYPGGILVIDEIDAGFHPHAQTKLIGQIRNVAKKLRIQVIATTHSLCLIETIHKDNNNTGAAKYLDKVVYIRDTVQPNVADYSIEQIRSDMHLIAPKKMPKPTKKELKVYLEDAEANFFLKSLLTRRLLAKIKLACDVTLKAIPISVGCDNLQGLQKFDKHFKTVLIAVDADATVATGRGAPKNVVKLPGGKTTAGKGMSPERTIYEFAKVLVGTNDRYPLARKHLASLGVTSDHIHEHLLSGDTNIEKRESAKKWMRSRLEHIDNWELVPLWLSEHPTEVRAFEEQLVEAAIRTAPLAE